MRRPRDLLWKLGQSAGGSCALRGSNPLPGAILYKRKKRNTLRRPVFEVKWNYF